MRDRPVICCDDPVGTRRALDDDVRDAVIRHLAQDPEAGGGEICVVACRGVVTLAGFVGDLAEKLAAERAAKRAPGVRVVANELLVKPRVARPGPEIAREIFQVLEAGTAGADIKASVRDGWVTVDGTAETQTQKNALEAEIRLVGGVRGVTNKLDVRAKSIEQDITRQIAEAVLQMAEVDVRNIRVDVADGTVTLSGTVRSWAEREVAERVAWATPGVGSVLNHIDLVP